jgi:sec-independent protein translocase protein TatB
MIPGFSGEMIFLFILVLILFGPKKMPEIARQVGRFMNEFRRASNEFRSQIESEINSLDSNANGSPRQQILPPLQAPLGSLANRIFNPPSFNPPSAEDLAEKLPDARSVAPEANVSAEAAPEPYPATKAAPDA